MGGMDTKRLTKVPDNGLVGPFDTVTRMSARVRQTSFRIEGDVTESLRWLKDIESEKACVMNIDRGHRLRGVLIDGTDHRGHSCPGLTPRGYDVTLL